MLDFFHIETNKKHSLKIEKLFLSKLTPQPPGLCLLLKLKSTMTGGESEMFRYVFSLQSILFPIINENDQTIMTVVIFKVLLGGIGGKVLEISLQINLPLCTAKI